VRYASLMDIGPVTEQRFIRDVLENLKIRTILERCLLQPNPLTDHRLLFRAKAASYCERWPWLTLVETERT